MKSFSKRYESLDESSLSFDRARRRIAYYIRSCVGSDFFLPCIIMIGGNGDKFLNKQQISGFSLSELGYDIMDDFDSDEYVFCRSSEDESGERNNHYLDKEFLDFVEIMIIFCEDKMRGEFVAHINDILQDESSAFLINGWMIITVQSNGSGSLIPFIRDSLLVDKLKPLYSNVAKTIDGSTKSRMAADALQLIFSSNKKGSTRTESERIVEKMADRWTDEAHKEEFTTLIDDTVKLIKEYNNNISNIRHTDRSTIRVRGESMYDFVASINTAMVGLAIEALQDEFIGLEDPARIRDRFLRTYKIDPSKSDPAPASDDALDLVEIPF